jgi:hypothetical protein
MEALAADTAPFNQGHFFSRTGKVHRGKPACRAPAQDNYHTEESVPGS